MQLVQQSHPVLFEDLLNLLNSSAASEDMYNAANEGGDAGANAGADAGGNPEDEVTDVDFEEVK